MNEELIDACIAHPQGLFLGPEDAKLVCIELRRLQAEVARLTDEHERGTAALRVAFGEELWRFGHPAYVVVHLREEIEKVTCLWKSSAAERDALLARVEAAEKDAARLKRGLKFYADGDHFEHDGAFDTVSGEPQNFWCDDSGSTVEDGTVAKKYLEGWDVDDNDQWIVPPAIDAMREGGT